MVCPLVEVGAGAFGLKRICISIVASSLTIHTASLASEGRAEGGAVSSTHGSQGEPTSPGEMAAAEFERGVERYGAADYEAAALAFARADRLTPSFDALGNALASAKKAEAHLLVVEIGRAILARAAVPEPLKRAADEEFQRSVRYLASVRIRCESVCKLSIDGAPSEEGQHFFLPGSHHLVAEFSQGGGRGIWSEEFEAGGARELVLVPPTDPPHQAPEATAASSAEVDGPLPVRAAPPVVGPENERKSDAGPRADRIVFSAGLVTTIVLSGATVWSGVDAMNYHHSLGGAPTDSEREENASRALRTDIFLGASLGAGLLTLSWALLGVDWKKAPPPLAVAFSPAGMTLGVRGQLP